MILQSLGVIRSHSPHDNALERRGQPGSLLLGESGLGETTMWSAPYANWYANQPDSGGVHVRSPTYGKRSDLQKLDTHGHPRTTRLYLGVKWSQVQILSARPLK